MNKKLLIAIPFLLLIAGACQKEEIKITEPRSDPWIYNTSNSLLIHNQVQAIAIDTRGAKWFGTVNGLSRFDGTSWTSFDTINSVLPSQFITALAADNKGNVWIGTNRGLILYDGDRFIRQEKMNNDFINKILVDNNGNTLWVGTDKGICRRRDTGWDRFDDADSPLIDGFVSSLAIDSKGILWMGTFDHYSFMGRLMRFDGTNWKGYRLDVKNLNSCFPDALVIDSQNVVWLGVKGTMGGILVKIEGEEWKLHNRFSPGFDDLKAGINSIALHGNVKWISSGDGLFSYDGVELKSYTVNNSGLTDDFILSLAIDSMGRKWIGTLRGGVVVFK